MQLKYFFLTPAIAAFTTVAFAQNRPVLSETSAYGSVSNMNTPAEVAIGTRLNTVIIYNPVLPISDPNNISASSSPDMVKQQQVFMDGSGAAFQTITKNVANVNGQAKHLIQVSDNRAQKDQYNFLPFISNDGNLQLNAFQKQRDYYANMYPNEGYTSFSKSVNTSSSTTRTMGTYSPGKSQVGQTRGTTSRLTTNAANEVRIWKLDGNGLPVSTGYYAANELFGSVTTLPSTSGLFYEPMTITYKDREGKLILKMVADSTYSSGVTFLNTYQYTYYVYNTKGQLVHTIQPKAYQYFLDNGNLPLNVVQNLCFSNLYDSKGRLSGSRIPGEDNYTWIVYDRKNRIVMSQTPKEGFAQEWEITFYDVKNRIKATSVYVDGLTRTRDAWQSAIDGGGGITNNTDLLYYLSTDAGEVAYPYNGSPYSLTSIIAGNTMMTYSWYDKYDVVDFTLYWAMCDNQLQFSGDLLNITGAETPKRSTRIIGMPTASMSRVLPSQNALFENLGDWIVNLNYYDDKGRAINSVNFSAEGALGGERFNFDFTGTQYDFSGRVLITKHVTYKHNVRIGETGYTHKELYKHQYDGTSGSLTTTLHRIDDGLWTTLFKISYDDFGKIKRKDLGGGGEIQDYSYNIRGQLTGINGNYAETGHKEGVSRTFGESLKYDYGFNYARYDGKIAGMVWRGASGLNMFAYGYDYTKSQSLKNADFSYLVGGTGWNNTDLDYSVSNLFYDKNGNIKSMKQRGEKPSVGPVDMDNLTYSYEANSNRLSQVVDNGMPYYGAGDFKNGTNSGADYSYDPNGNLTKDLNRDVNGFSYTRFNKPDRITKSDGSYIEYSYDAKGNKLEEIVYDKNGPYKRTDYIGNCVYQNNTETNSPDDNLKYMLTPEGRTVFDPKSVSALREEFFVQDHLGNVRSTINVLSYSTRNYLATYEVASANIEHLIFSGIDEVRDTKPGGNGDDVMAANLNGADPQRRVGSSLLVHVMAGDKVAMSVNTLYNNGYRADEDQPIPADQALDAIIGTLAGGVGAIPGEGHNVKLVKDVFNSSNYTVFNDLINTTTDPSKPKAFLNYVLFDENMKIVNSMTGAFQANGDNNWSVIGTTTAMEVPLNGYLAVYLSNNSSSRVNCLVCTDVFFDDLRFTVTKGSLLEETHYYPFGLPIQGLSSVTADGFTENRHKYQGNELTKDLQLNLMDFQARQYDPQIGRFLSVDPMAASGGQDMFSPYAAMGNTPEGNVDPNGLMPVDKTRYANQSRTWDFIQADGSPGGGAGSASGQGRDAWADGGFGRDSYGALSGFGNGMDAGAARWASAQPFKDLVAFVNSFLKNGGTRNYSRDLETGEELYFGGGKPSTSMEATMDASSLNLGYGPGSVGVSGGLLGWALDAVQEIFGSATVPNWATMPYIVSGTFTISEARAIAKQSSVEQRGNQPGSYTIVFSNGHKYHGKGPINRMFTSATLKMSRYTTIAVSFDWRPAPSERAAHKQEYLRMQTDRTPEYPEGYSNPINYNIIQSWGKVYLQQDGNNPN